MVLVGLDENDSVANATAFTRTEGVSYPVGFDPHFAVGTAYGVNALPQTFFLNAKHQIVDRVFGKVTLASLHKGMALASWLVQPAVGASTTAGQMPIAVIRQDTDAVVPPSQRWLYTQAPDPVVPKLRL